MTESLNSCSNCKHWERDGEPYDEVIDAKRCRYAVHTEDAEYSNKDTDWEKVLKPEYKDTKAFVMDGSGYMAYFYTKEDFGCNQHEERDE